MKRVLFILGVLDDDDIDWLISTGKRQEIPQNTVLIHEGKPIDAIYFLLDGTLTVQVAALKDQIIAHLSSGEVVGEMSFVDTRLPSATVKAITPSLVLAIPKDRLIEKLEQDVWFAARFYRALAILLSTRLRGTVQKIHDAAHWRPLDLSDETFNLDMAANMSLAAIRFDWLLRRLRDGAIET
ncbi:cyclic nucleotide-binding domain-containing protein [Almyronema epifaneia]|uniref:Cyclic nucleotide-binding domain-containing protein n=1 Tax=Almyronema epifaneia S1 TaxID=2991925 RepID=A0ABW6IHB6_9CYAN